MLYDKDEEEEDEELTEYEEWFIENEYYFPMELREQGIDSLEMEMFYHQVYKPVVADMSVTLRKVMMDQHPSMSREIRPRIVEQIEAIVPDMAHQWITQLYTLVYYAENGFDLRKQYSSFEYWEQHNNFLQGVLEREREEMKEYEDLSDDEIDLYVDEYERQKVKDYFYIVRRRAAIHDAFITPILKHFDRILNISGDAWTVFAGLTDDNFVEYRERAWNLDTFTKFSFPEEYIDLDPVKYHEILTETISQKQQWNFRIGRALAEEDKI